MNGARPASVVTGVSGKLGSRMAQVLASSGPVFGTYLTRARPDATAVDLTDAAAVRGFFERAPHPVGLCVHCAARTDPRACEDDAAGAWAANVDATRNVARECAGRGIAFVYVSTDYVFDGTKSSGGYGEDDRPNPLQVYGRTKLAGEEVAAAEGAGLVVRLPLLYAIDSGTVPTWPQEVLARLSRGERVPASDREIRQPTEIGDVCDIVVKLVSAGAGGTIHIAAQEGRTKYEWARELARLHGYDEALVRRADSDGVTRPLRAWLRADRLEDYGIPLPRPVTETTRL